MMCSALMLGLVLLQFSFLEEIIHLLPSNTILIIVVMGLSFFCLRLSGQGALTLTSKNLIGKWFINKRGRASAMSGVAISFGFSIVPSVFLILIEAFSWQGAYQLLALIVGVFVMIFAWIFYRNTPEECGLSVDGGLNKDAEIESAEVESINLKAAKKSFAFWAICLVLSIQGMMITGFTFHIEDIGRMAGLSREEVVRIFIPMASVSIPVGIISGWLADRIKMKYRVTII